MKEATFDRVEVKLKPDSKKNPENVYFKNQEKQQVRRVHAF